MTQAAKQRKNTKIKKWILLAGARPNFMKIAPLLRSIREHNLHGWPKIDPFLVHSGQHYDENMSGLFFRDLFLPEPDDFLGVGSGSHAEQTGKVLIAFENILAREKPDLVIVVGDVNSTMAGALAAAKMHVPLAHVEAGLRSFDRGMPEEINRIVTDVLADYLFTPSSDGNANLRKEGVDPRRVFLVGDIMVDSLRFYLEKAENSDIKQRLGLLVAHNLGKMRQTPEDQKSKKVINEVRPYAVLTLHRPINVDFQPTLRKILRGLLLISSMIPIIFPVHPRTKKKIDDFKLNDFFEFHAPSNQGLPDYFKNGRLKKKIHLFDPFGYVEFLSLMMNARLVLTDSGGIQEETTVLNVPCITLRDSTERPITLVSGTNTLVPNDPARMAEEVRKILAGQKRKVRLPPLWDGHTAERIVKILVGALDGSSPLNR